MQQTARLIEDAPDKAGAADGRAAMAGGILTVDLAAIRANYRLLRERLGGVACAAVVKADAYGLGVGPVAAALVREGCVSFFVAHLAEGLQLRGLLGPAPAIHVLNGLPPTTESACAAAGLVPVLNSRAQVDAWRAAARRAGRRLKAALQLDSGMARLGLSPDNVRSLAVDPASLDGIDVVLVMSHLARADEPHEAASARQRGMFAELSALLPAAPRSLANSAGIFLGPANHHELARPGAALYGINPTAGAPNPMRAVVRLEARVIQTRTVAAGAGIGYGHAHVAAGPMRLATIALGYADGWHRRGASAAFAHGARLPFVGRVSMDSIILDIGALPPDRLSAGELVELIGPHQSVDDVARQTGTIGYEVLTSFGPRLHRVYRED